MSIWLALSLILAVTAIYMFMIEIFSVAFKLTGLATNKLKFQVASLFTGAGFTTTESELITNDDRRRRIAMICMYTGHIFSVVIMGLVINVLISIWAEVSSEQTSYKEWYFIVFYVSLGLFLLVAFVKIPPINRRFQRWLEKIAIKTSRSSRNTNIITVVDYYGRSAVVEVVLNHLPEYAQEVSLFDMKLTKKYALIILSIRRGNRRVQVSKDTMLAKGDALLVYGLINDIREAFVDSLEKNENKKDYTIAVNNVNELRLLNNYGTNALMEVFVEEVPTELDDIKLIDSHLTDRYSINIVVLKRKDEYISVDKDTIIKKGDVLTLFGPIRNIRHLFYNSDK